MFICNVCEKKYIRESSYIKHIKICKIKENTNKIQKPFLKWVGGKTQIIDKIISNIPKEINNYHEIFLGGGSVLLAVLSLQKNKNISIKNKIYAYDINESLINLYKDVQNNYEELHKHLQKYYNDYSNVENKKECTREKYYYIMRKIFNSMENKKIEKSALFIFLNKTCFRGMYREGPNGFNIPYGHYKTIPKIISLTELKNISELINNVIFIHSSFEVSLKNVIENDFVYLDPPYAPENEKSFVGYTKNGFNLSHHILLFEEILKIDKNDNKFLLSNSNVDLVTKFFKDYNCENIIARRAINSKNPGSTAKEVLISN